jgi:hypothetical protein
MPFLRAGWVISISWGIGLIILAVILKKVTTHDYAIVAIWAKFSNTQKASVCKNAY